LSGNNNHGTVAARFSAAASTYDRHASAQRAAADEVVKLLAEIPPPGHVLEIGCGTGILTERITVAFPSARICAQDTATAMLEQARSRVGESDRLDWTSSEIDTIDTSDPFDLVVSSSTLHWMLPLSRTFQEIAALLSEKGHLVFTIMLAGTLRELREARSKIAPRKIPRLSLPDTGDVMRSLDEAGFSPLWYDERVVGVLYESASDLLWSLHEQGLTGGPLSTPGVHLTRGEIEKLIAYYHSHYRNEDGGVLASYRILAAAARRDRS